MSGEQRRRLATAAGGAGYPGTLLQSIAQATLPKYRPGQQLAEQQLGQVADAVELLDEAGLSAAQVAALIAGCRQRAAERWREHFWTLALQAARANARPARAHAG
jgi:hypothetical protein